MHYHAEVWVPNLRNVYKSISTMMGPYQNTDDNTNSFWDHWTIGGRWDGEISPYNILPVNQVVEDMECHTLMLPNTKPLFLDENFDGKIKGALERCQIKDGHLVTVDYHS